MPLKFNVKFNDNSQKFSLITKFSYHDKLLKSLNLRRCNSQSFPVLYSVDNKTAEMTLKFDLRRSNSQNFPEASPQTPHINKLHKMKSTYTLRLYQLFSRASHSHL